MPDTFPNPEAVLAFQALLYASGELEGDEARAFEQRLAADQAAREALGQAVQLTMSLAGEESRPDPSWRERAKARLQPRTPLLEKLAARRSYRGHPALWALSGAAAAMLMMAVTLGQQQPQGPVMAQAPIVVQPAPVDPEPGHSRFGKDLVAVAPTNEQAYHWATLHNTDHLTRTHDEETRRKLRLEEQKRMTNKMDAMKSPRSNRPSEK